MRGFRRTRQGVTTTFGAPEAELLHALVVDLLTLLDRAGDTGAGTAPEPDAADDPLVGLTGLGAGAARDPGTPDDPVLARLFPDAYRLDDDPGQAEAAADYRRFVRADLQEGKAAGLRLVRDSLPLGGGPVVLDGAAADAWLSALTDLRLALGTRLGVSEELAENPPPPGDPRRPALEVYDFLGWLQETLVHAVAGW